MNFKAIAIGFVLTIACFLFVVLIVKKSYIYALLSFIMICFLIYFMIDSVSIREKLDIDVIVKAYKQLLAEKFRYDVEENCTIFYTEELRNTYMIVLKDMMLDGETRYWPFECDKYELKFGRGTGTFKIDFAEIKNWMLSAMKSQVNTLFLDMIEKRLDSEYRNTVLEDYEKSRKRNMVKPESNDVGGGIL